MKVSEEIQYTFDSTFVFFKVVATQQVDIQRVKSIDP